MSGIPRQKGGLSERRNGSQQQCTASRQSLSKLKTSVPRTISHKYCHSASLSFCLHSTDTIFVFVYNTCTMFIHTVCILSTTSVTHWCFKENIKEDPDGFLKQRGRVGPQLWWVDPRGEAKDADSNARVWHNHRQDWGLLWAINISSCLLWFVSFDFNTRSSSYLQEKTYH